MNELIRACLVILLLSFVGLSSAQTGPVSEGKGGTGGIPVSGTMGALSGKPFTASWKATDLNMRIVGSGKIGRDAGARIYIGTDGLSVNKIKIDAPGSSDVLNLAEQTDLFWTTNSKLATLTHNLKNPNLGIAFGEAEARVEGGDYEVRQLGTKTILGVSSVGTLATRVLQEGWKSSGQPVTVTDERWYSKDLQIIMLDIVHDTSGGGPTWELTSLALTDPNPTLFELPAEYSVTNSYASDVKSYSAGESKPPR